VNIGNRDLGHIVNGFPGDPLEKRPFDKYFMTVKIVNTWTKVRYELGECGAPEEAQKRMKLLVGNHEKCGKELDHLGFNGGVMDIEAREVEEIDIPEDEEALIQYIEDNKLISTKLVDCSSVVYKLLIV